MTPYLLIILFTFNALMYYVIWKLLFVSFYPIDLYTKLSECHTDNTRIMVQQNRFYTFSFKNGKTQQAKIRNLTEDSSRRKPLNKEEDDADDDDDDDDDDELVKYCVIYEEKKF